MKILIAAATFEEIKPLLAFLSYRKKTGFLLQPFAFGKHKIDVLITGAGMMHTAFHLGKILPANKYGLAVNIGIAGSFDKKIPIGAMVNVTEDRFGDLGAENGEKFLDMTELGLLKRAATVFAPNLTGFNDLSGLKRLRKVKAITVNKVHGNGASIRKIVKKYNPQTESMEGAAFFYACNEEKTSCLQIRAVSNYVERRNKKSWQIPLAVKNLNIFIIDFLKEI